MAGPYQQYPDSAASHPRYNEPHPSQPFARPPDYDHMPPPEPRRRQWRLLAVALVVVLILGSTAGAVVYAVRTDSEQSGAGGTFTPATAQAAIQNYLDALSQGDADTVARNLLCGMYDAVRDHRADRGLAKLASEAFRDQFSSAKVTGIDKIVYWSPNQAQVLFTMSVTPVSRSAQTEEQATAQLLFQDDQVLVCQYLLRGRGQY